MMQLEILRVGSVVPNGVGGPLAGSMGFIYSMLLQEFGQFNYGMIWINQIGADLDELVIKERKHIYINIRYPARENFDQLSEEEQNNTRLEVTHLSLMRIADHDKKLDKEKLNLIREHILKHDFNLVFTYKQAV